MKEGWGPLCEFLGVEVPENEPFPHLNDTEAFRRRVRLSLAVAATGLAGGFSLAVLGLLLLLRKRLG